MALQVETWFPLAVCYEDLPPPAEVKAGMLAHLQPLIDRHLSSEAGQFAWTGDKASCWQLHEVEAFRWIRSHVERRTLEFARILGVDLSVLGFYFQRTWPVLSRKGEQVSRHAHPNAMPRARCSRSWLGSILSRIRSSLIAVGTGSGRLGSSSHASWALRNC